MIFTEQERGVLARAMGALAQDDSRGFCDILWLGLGDRWQDILKLLADARHVRITDRDAADGVRITQRGRALAANLAGQARRSA